LHWYPIPYIKNNYKIGFGELWADAWWLSCEICLFLCIASQSGPLIVCPDVIFMQGSVCACVCRKRERY